MAEAQNPFESLIARMQREHHTLAAAQEIKGKMHDALAQDYAEVCVKAREHDHLLRADSSGDVNQDDAAAALIRHQLGARTAKMLSALAGDPGMHAEYLAQMREHKAMCERWVYQLGRMQANQREQ